MNVRTKYNIARALKVIFYLLGFPLFVLFVTRDSLPLFDSDYFSGNAMTGIKIAFGIWAAVSLVQFGLYLAGTKQKVRVLVSAALAVILMITPMLILDSTAKKDFEEITANAPDGVNVEIYDKQVQWFVTISDKGDRTGSLSGTIDDFVKTYGLGGYYGKTYRAITQVNTPAVSADGKINYFKDGDAKDEAIRNGEMIYNPNGLLYDGYVFGVREAVDLLIEYNEFKAQKVFLQAVNGKYTQVDGKYVVYNAGTHGAAAVRYNMVTADKALELAKAAAELSPEWIAYSSTDEFKANYAEAAKYWITEERLDEVLDAVLRGPVDTLIDSLRKNQTLNLLLNAVPALLPAVGDILNAVNSEDTPITLDILLNLVYDGILHDMLTGYTTETNLEKYANGKIKATDFAKTLYSIGVYGNLSEDEAVAKLIGAGNTPVATKAELKTAIIGLLRNLSYYIHPENQVSWQFINETPGWTATEVGVDLERYAWVKYHCEEFGRIAGCVLAETDALLVGGSIGNGTSPDKAYKTAALQQLKTDISYKADYYPLFAARRYMLIFAGICALSIFFSSFFAQKENEYLKKFYEGGND